MCIRDRPYRKPHANVLGFPVEGLKIEVGRQTKNRLGGFSPTPLTLTTAFHNHICGEIKMGTIIICQVKGDRDRDTYYTRHQLGMERADPPQLVRVYGSVSPLSVPMVVVPMNSKVTVK